MRYFFLKNYRLLVASGLFIFMFALPIFSCLAQENLTGGMLSKLQGVEEGLSGTTSTDETSFPKLVGQIIQAVTGTLSVFLVGIIFYAGYLYMTAGGDQNQVKKAKDWATNGIIGLLLSVSAYALTDYAVQKLIIAATTPS